MVGTACSESDDIDRETRASFAAWRSRRRVGQRIPEALWAKAVAAARVHGVDTVVRELRVAADGLQRRLDGNGGDESRPSLAVAPLVRVVPDDSADGGWSWRGLAPGVQCDQTMVVEVVRRDGDRLVVRHAGLDGAGVAGIVAAFAGGGSCCR